MQVYRTPILTLDPNAQADGGLVEVVKLADAQATIAALQVDKEDAQDANRLLRRELDKLREKYDAECVMSEGLQSHLTQRTAELHETQNHLADADNEVEQLRKQLSERTAELEAAKRLATNAQWQIDYVLDEAKKAFDLKGHYTPSDLVDCVLRPAASMLKERDVLKAELERVRGEAATYKEARQ